jgi:hypothetical protein
MVVMGYTGWTDEDPEEDRDRGYNARQSGSQPVEYQAHFVYDATKFGIENLRSYFGKWQREHVGHEETQMTDANNKPAPAKKLGYNISQDSTLNGQVVAYQHFLENGLVIHKKNKGIHVPYSRLKEFNTQLAKQLQGFELRIQNGTSSMYQRVVEGVPGNDFVFTYRSKAEKHVEINVTCMSDRPDFSLGFLRQLVKFRRVIKGDKFISLLTIVNGQVSLSRQKVDVKTFSERHYNDTMIPIYHKMMKKVNTGDGVGKIALLTGLPGTAKCLGLGTKVIKFDGSIVNVEDVVVGDVLMGPDSKPRIVQSVSRGESPLYKIVPTKGESWVCNDVHVLTLVHSTKNEVVDIALPDYMSSNKSFKEKAKLFQPENGVEFQTSQDKLPIDPYFVGVWLGDGTKQFDVSGVNPSRLNGVHISKPDQEIRDMCANEAAKWGLALNTTYGGNTNSCPTYRLSAGRGLGEPKENRNPLLTEMQKLFPNRVIHIPAIYLRASRAERLELLAGILDTDGYLGDNCYEISQKSVTLANDIAFLARSVGLKVTQTVTTVNKGHYTKAQISGHVDMIPCRIARKQAQPRKQVKNALRTGFKVESIGVGPYAGFTLDGDGRFLLGDFTVTHNTTLLQAIAHDLDEDKAIAAFVNPWDFSQKFDDNFVIQLADQCRGKRLVLFIEDSEAIIGPRNDGNSGHVSRLLNLTDGILGKILDIFVVCTANQRQVDIDSALTRAGRCLVNVEVLPLEREKANGLYWFERDQLCKKHGLECVTPTDEKAFNAVFKDEATVAEVYQRFYDDTARTVEDSLGQTVTTKKKGKMGFGS